MISPAAAASMPIWRRSMAVAVTIGGVTALLYLIWRWGCMGWPSGDWHNPVLAAAAYLAAHLVRAVRLFLLLNDGRLRFGMVLVGHFHAAGVSALIPFKLGEGYRIGVLGGICGDPVRAIMAVWIERLYDMVMITVLFASCALLAGAWPDGLRWFLALAAGFLFASALIFCVLPENLGLLKRYLVLRHNRPWVPRALAAIDRLHRLLQTAAAVGRHRRATIIWLGLLIWSLEATVIAMVGGFIPDAVSSLLRIAAVEGRVWQAPLHEAAVLRLVSVDVLVAGAFLLAPILAIAVWRSARIRNVTP